MNGVSATYRTGPQESAMNKGKDIKIVGYVVHETDLAIRFRPHLKAASFWLPKSQIARVSLPNDRVEITMSEWLASQKGIRCS